MTKQRKIIHIDMDCFYAAIEMREDPSLKNIPIAVGGLGGRRGVLCTSNYPARKFNIRSAMPSATALKLCPSLKILPVRMSLYKEESYKIREIFKRYTKKIEPLSLDEAFLDVSDCPLYQGSASLIAKEILETIYRERQLPASAGIAPNKFLAKIASDWKKPQGLFVIPPEKVKSFVENLPVKKISGVGPVLNEKLLVHKIKTCLDIKKKGLSFMAQYFGNIGAKLYQKAHGIDERKVESLSKVKTLSVEYTFSTDLDSWMQWEAKSLLLWEELKCRYQKFRSKSSTPLIPKSICVKIKNHQFKSRTKETSRISFEKELTQKDFTLFLQLTKELFKIENAPIRLLGLGLKFKSSTSSQLEFI